MESPREFNAAAVFGRIAERALRPPRRRTVAQWAEEERIIARESGSPTPGKWRNTFLPHMVEIMECMSLHHPCQHVVIMKCLQSGGSEVALNLIGSCITDNPSPILIVLPTTEEIKRYVKTKLGPMIEFTPAVNALVSPTKSRDEDGSTTAFKRFQGGWMQLTGANSSSGLKMISVRVVIREEITEYPDDVDGLGDPAELAWGRATTWANQNKAKVVDVSTPGIKGDCRISANYERSDMRRLYLPCPSCGAFQILRWEHLGKDASVPVYTCQGHGCVIGYRSLRGMLMGCRWLKTYPGTDENPAPPPVIEAHDIARWHARGSAGREPGFHFNAISSPLMKWTDIVQRWRNVRGKTNMEKDFSMQVLAEPWEERGEGPDEKRLLSSRAAYEWRKIPKTAPLLFGAADVQGNRIEWAVYSYGQGLECWLIDKGIIEGDPASAEIWQKLDAIICRQYADHAGNSWPVDAFGIDTGHATNWCYLWARGHAHTNRVFALDGRAGWRLPALGTPNRKDIDFGGRKLGTVLLWPVGTWALKSEIYAGLDKLVRGKDEKTGEYAPGTMYIGDMCDSNYCSQLTAESLVVVKDKRGMATQSWRKPKDRANEALDIAVYARALAHHFIDGMTPDDWASIFETRGSNMQVQVGNARPQEQSSQRTGDGDGWFKSNVNDFWN